MARTIATSAEGSVRVDQVATRGQADGLDCVIDWELARCSPPFCTRHLAPSMCTRQLGLVPVAVFEPTRILQRSVIDGAADCVESMQPPTAPAANSSLRNLLAGGEHEEIDKKYRVRQEQPNRKAGSLAVSVGLEGKRAASGVSPEFMGVRSKVGLASQSETRLQDKVGRPRPVPGQAAGRGAGRGAAPPISWKLQVLPESWGKLAKSKQHGAQPLA
ncbi:hypothetical protein PG999_012646 [Apiospora kogelbergensis]|uniref:Uncharacterized protein n=1 Tax=Apiospora kogelbergensis TaxID=1337665 RepID=A0AAW0Q8L3_9PEZI